MTLVADFNSSVNVPFQRMRQLLFEQGGGIQEGVIGINDLKVVQRGAGANQSVDVGLGAAWVQIDTGTRNGLGHVYNDATANVTVTASNGTNPRIDQIILRWNDTSIPTGAGNVPTLEVLTGTATSGATLDNRTGAAALPNDCMRLADLLIPTSSTSVVTANIRDRRPWARGAFNIIIRNTADYTTASASYVEIDATNLKPRLELSGAPVRQRLVGVASHSVAAALTDFQPWIDGAVINAVMTQVYAPAAANNVGFVAETTYIPAAGSHLLSFAWLTSAATATLRASAAAPLVFTVEELIRPNVANT